MPYCPSVFQRLLEPLDRRELKRIVAAHDGDKGVGKGATAWTCERHLKALLFGQFAGLASLREIEQALAAKPSALYHLGLRPPKRSTLSDASAARPAAVFRDLAAHLADRLGRSVRREGTALIEILDSSPIRLDSLARGRAGESRFAWAEADARIFGLKLHLLYAPRENRPVRFDITSPKTPDLAFGRGVALEAGVTYVFDKGYADYGWWRQIVEAGAVFVTRLKRNTHVRGGRARKAKGDGILADRRIRIGHKQPRGGAINPLYDTDLREVVVAREGKAPLRLVTNDLTRPAAEIAALYKERWQIELVFKWLKQNLKIKTFLGRSENAVKLQIYVALIAFLLLRLFQNRLAAASAASAKTLIARLKVALFDRLDLTGRAKPPPTGPKMRPPSPQLSFPLPC